MKQDHAQFCAAQAYNDAYNDRAGDRVAQFLPMVRRLAWHFAGSTGPVVDMDDLMQVGLIALAEAARRHHGPNEDGFAAYAKIRVKGAMIDLLRKESALPRGERARNAVISDARDRLTAQSGRLPNDAELAREVGVSTGAIRASAGRVRVVSLEDVSPDVASSLRSEAPDPEQAAVAREERALLAAAIAMLPEKQALVIQLYFVEELNLSEIARVLDVSVPRVHQIKSAALDKLRHCFPVAL